MLPIRWIVPIVGALFALALLPWVFNPLPTSPSLPATSVKERPERRQAIVPIGVQRKELNSRDLDAPPIDTAASLPATDDVSGSIDTTGPVPATPALKTTTRRTKHVRRPTAYHRSKHARAAINFGNQRSWQIPKQEFKFNAN